MPYLVAIVPDQPASTPEDAILLCPHCQGATSPLAVLSSVSLIDFFQCKACAKISERPKGNDGNPVPLLVALADAETIGGALDRPPARATHAHRYAADAVIPFPRAAVAIGFPRGAGREL